MTLCKCLKVVSKVCAEAETIEPSAAAHPAPHQPGVQGCALGNLKFDASSWHGTELSNPSPGSVPLFAAAGVTAAPSRNPCTPQSYQRCICSWVV